MGMTREQAYAATHHIYQSVAGTGIDDSLDKLRELKEYLNGLDLGEARQEKSGRNRMLAHDPNRGEE